MPAPELQDGSRPFALRRGAYRTGKDAHLDLVRLPGDVGDLEPRQLGLLLLRGLIPDLLEEVEVAPQDTPVDHPMADLAELELDSIEFLAQ